MLKIIDNRNIEITRGDMLPLTITANNLDGTPYTFQKGDIVRFTVFDPKNVSMIALTKDFEVDIEGTEFDIVIPSEDMKIGELSNKPTLYWYEIELNPDTPNCNTIVGYDNSLGASTLTLLVEGGGKS